VPVDTPKPHRGQDAVAHDRPDAQHHQHPQHILSPVGLDEPLAPVGRRRALLPVLSAASGLGALPPQLCVQRKGAAWCTAGSTSY
jgi:hypothetical protein